MSISSPALRRVAARSIIAAACVLACIVPGRVSAVPVSVVKPIVLQPIVRDVPHENWRKALVQLRLPSKGCFLATFPESKWRATTCAVAPSKPYPPARGLHAETVGNGLDFTAHLGSTITSAEGEFVSASDITSEVGGTVGKPGTPNSFSLQLNTNTFDSPACAHAKVPKACTGWQQFVFSNSGVLFTQYWLIGYDTTCPSGWNTYEDDCWRNGNAVSTPTFTASQVRYLGISATAKSGGNDEGYFTNVGANNQYVTYSESDSDSVLDLSHGWNNVEFNVFGDCCSTQAQFNIGAAFGIYTSPEAGNAHDLTCLRTGYTGETNNLNLTGTPQVEMRTGYLLSVLSFTETTTAAPTPSCP